ncbi:Putative Glycosyltransferases protein [Halomicronema hongdechloris C2206]|uniref:Glycosyltransferases protein n=1 Tax=Halomicronema hongdechloris C2206 TaxID=1641165 RepID=A0A1Z3HU18_9CYAN|nr:lipid-A-disaccharide synthase-related protein [Halomicronema hongdechloris]ASC73765.1 Putative Glycosyltransferases protein [Halomicronema hongdechloris C2206]
MPKRLLFLSNGHGEDLNASLVLAALRQLAPEVDVAALPIVGEGQAYQQLGVPIIGPTQQLPSGGFLYINVLRLLNPCNWQRDLNPINLVRDLFSGLISLTWGQLQAVRRYGRHCDLVLATGDVVPILFAYLTGRPFVAFLVSMSSYYEGRLKLPWLAQACLRSHRCRLILTRDAFTAKDLQRRGMGKARFAGYPIMDVLQPTGRSLKRQPGMATIALLPGSRLPEAHHNFALQLKLCDAIVTQYGTVQFEAALVPAFRDEHLQTLAQTQGWTLDSAGHLHRANGLRVMCYRDAFADILHHCDLVIGMAGTAVEQAVGLGKPVIQIIGPGPQFTYPFAEAQMRLLGPSVITVGRRMATPPLLLQAATKAVAILNDVTYRQRCQDNGKERVGPPGGSRHIAQQLLSQLSYPS